MSTSGTAKKDKKNKIPQRGLGVAQLEKLRLEEQQRNAGAAASPPPALSNPSARSNPTWPFAPSPPAASGVARKTSRSPTPSPSPFVDYMGAPPPRQDSVAVAARSSGSGFSPTPCGGSVAGYQEEDDRVRAFPNDSLSVGWGLVTQMRQQQQHQHESLVALANRARTPSSSGNNVQIEPPSNQNVTSNYDLLTSWRQSKMAGAKRDCPFQQDSSVCQPASNPRKVSALTRSHRKFEESLPSHGNSAVLSETQSAVFGGSNSGSSVFNRSSEVQVDRKGKQDVATADGAFLTLGPIAQPVLNTTLSSGENSDHSSVLCQESLKSSSISHGRRFYNFLPPTDKDHEATSPDTSPEKKEAKKDVDLNLKL